MLFLFDIFYVSWLIPGNKGGLERVWMRRSVYMYVMACVNLHVPDRHRIDGACAGDLLRLSSARLRLLRHMQG